jgi:hypothetical protein
MGVPAMTRSPMRLRFLSAIACLTIATGCAGTARQPDLVPGERRAFRASSMHTDLFMVGAFEGMAEVWRDSVLVLVTTGRIDTRGHRDGDVVLRVALANGDTARRWRVGDASAAAPLSSIRRDGAGNLVDTLRFSLKRPSRPLYDQWLVFVFELPGAERASDGRPLLHTAFAHSQRDVFRPPPRVGDAQP